MIFLKSIHLHEFKGIKDLECQFDDLTILAGLNNSGKTSVLEALHILISSLPRVVQHPQLFSTNVQQRQISLDDPLAALGLPDPGWLMPHYNWDAGFCITGRFAAGFDVAISPIARGNFSFAVGWPDDDQSQEKLRELARSIESLASEFITAPGIVASHEDMIPGPQYDGLLRQGKATQYWRNSLWWPIQDEGVEQFDPVRTLVQRYFPDVNLAIPVLNRKQNPPGIDMKYNERGQGALDIAQSGAGLRTFMTLARLIEQSQAQVALFDEPDAHLHASQQAVVLDLLMDVTTNSDRQVIIATHSPELLSRAPTECVRWLERDSLNPTECEDRKALLVRLGAAPDTYLPLAGFPDVIVYVEGKTDRLFVESLITWCRRTSEHELPQTLVVVHNDGRFDAMAIQSLARLVAEIQETTRIVGIRDLDWYYSDKPNLEPDARHGQRWMLITLPCKELENLLCDVHTLYAAYQTNVAKEQLKTILDEESEAEELIHEWKVHVQPRIRERLPAALADPTKEQQVMETFDEWKSDAGLRARLVAGKRLLRKVRERIKREYELSCYPSRMFDHMKDLTPALTAIADAIFVDGPSVSTRGPPE